jgi:hypothetical protein
LIAELDSQSFYGNVLLCFGRFGAGFAFILVAQYQQLNYYNIA